MIAFVATMPLNNALYSETKEDSKTIEKRAQKLENNIMAPCCFGGTLTQHAESQLTVEMKARIRMLLKQGLSDKKVIDSMVKYYGQKLNLPPNQWERIRATPEAKGFNLLVWFLPIIALLAGAILVYWLLKRFVMKNKQQSHSKPADETSNSLSPEMHQRIENQLKNYRY